MKSSPNATAPRNSNANHPPLARNAQGHPIALPDGTESFLIKRETRGRPKVLTGPDGHPYRLSLDAADQYIADNFGPGTYRLDAVDALGNVIDYVTTIKITADELDEDDEDDEADEDEPDAGARAAGSTDLRYALQALTQMARAQADSLRAVTEAQADWVKGLASAKALPRNAMVVAPSALLTSEHDDGADDSSHHGGDSPPSSPSPDPQPADWVVGMQAAQKLGENLAPALGLVASLIMKRFGGAASDGPATKPTVATTPTAPPPPTTSPGSAEPAAVPATPPTRSPMIHLAEINAGLSADERRFLELTLRSRDGEVLAAELLSHSVSDAITLVVDATAEVRSSAARARAQAQRPRSTPHAATNREAPTAPTLASEAPATEVPDAISNTVATTPPGRAATQERAAVAQAFMARVMAVAAHLDAGEQATIMALLTKLAPDRLQELQRDLLAMSAEDAAAWIRQNLPVLCAEVER